MPPMPNWERGHSHETTFMSCGQFQTTQSPSSAPTSCNWLRHGSIQGAACDPDPATNPSSRATVVRGLCSSPPALQPGTCRHPDDARKHHGGRHATSTQFEGSRWRVFHPPPGHAGGGLRRGHARFVDGPGHGAGRDGTRQLNGGRTGWNSDSFAIVTSQPVVNPAACPIPDGYVSARPAPGYATYYDAAKLAWQTSRRVQVSIDVTLCVGGRPKIIGINVLP